MTTSPYSDDFSTVSLLNDLFGVTLGLSGTVQYGGQCWPPDGDNMAVAGRIGFTIGNIGSIQDETDDQGNLDPTRPKIDNNMRLQFGMPRSPGAVSGYAMVVDDAGAKTAFGSADFGTTYVGASNRYIYTETVQDGIAIQLQIDLAGDAARLQWKFQSTAVEATQRALWFGQWVNMLTYDGQGNIGQSGAWYVNAPGSRPLVVDTIFNRLTNPAVFPDRIDFGMSQAKPYGLRVLNGPDPATMDSAGLNSDQTVVEELIVGATGRLLGGPYSNDLAMPGATLPDTYFISPGQFKADQTAYIQKFPLFAVPGSATPFSQITPQVVAYYKSTTGVSNYALPYSVVVDTPKLIQVDAANPDRFLPNPGRFRVYVDNTGGFGEVQKEIDLEGVKVTLSLPDGMFEYNPAEVDPLNPKAPKRVISKFIDLVRAKRIGFVDFVVGVNKNTFGELSYQVKVQPASTIVSKTLNGSITVASQPRMLIRGTEGGITGANLVSPPWQFSQTNWEAILSQPTVPMRFEQEFRAFTWDPVIQSYIPQTGPERGRGTFIISKKDLGYAEMGGDPVQPSDLKSGAPLIQLKSGWNLIGNPYNYAFPLAQVIGVSGAIGTKANTFQELVDQGVVSGSIAYWDQDTQSYRYIDVTGQVHPNRGYWIYVATPQDLTLSFPPIYEPYLRSGDATAWTQSDKQWRLQLAVRGVKSVDDQNYVGLARSTKDALRLRMAKPPVAPVEGAVSASVRDLVNGKPIDMASAFTDKAGRMEWTLNVASKDAGQVTVTWPNLSTLPKNLRLRITDLATQTTRDMRRSSGYTFTTTEANTSREFRVQIEPGVASTAKIGTVLVTRTDGRDIKSSPINVSYTLTSDATTTVRILAADGREVYVPTRGRADGAGANSVTWNLRDAANRAVAPGTYKVEITAETPDGERVRKIVPVVVVR